MYNNKLIKIKELAKRNYFNTQFDTNRDNIKMTWKLIGMLINRKKNANRILTKLLYNKKCYTTKLVICDHLNSYFVNVGSTLSAQLHNYDNPNPNKYVTSTYLNSFMFRSILAHEVHDLIKNLNTSKSTIIRNSN